MTSSIQLVTISVNNETTATSVTSFGQRFTSVALSSKVLNHGSNRRPRGKGTTSQPLSHSFYALDFSMGVRCYQKVASTRWHMQFLPHGKPKRASGPVICGLKWVELLGYELKSSHTLFLLSSNCKIHSLTVISQTKVQFNLLVSIFIKHLLSRTHLTHLISLTLGRPDYGPTKTPCRCCRAPDGVLAWLYPSEQQPGLSSAQQIDSVWASTLVANANTAQLLILIYLSSTDLCMWGINTVLRNEMASYLMAHKCD